MDKYCLKCGNQLIKSGMFWCNSCKLWFEEIDFLSPEEKEKLNEDCKKCTSLAKTEFKKNNLTVFVCNSFKSTRIMEKIKDFRKCKAFQPN